MAEEEAIQEQPPKKRGGGLRNTLIIVAIVAVVEGAGFYAVARIFGGGPQTAIAAEGEHLTEGDDPTPEQQTVEIELLTGFRVPNDKRGAMHVYDFDVLLKVYQADAEAVQAIVDTRRGEISDLIARIVRAAEPAMLHEPELTTLRLKIRHVLGEMVGDPEKVLEVLIPRFLPIRVG